MQIINNNSVSAVIHSDEIYRNTLLKYMQFFGLQPTAHPSLKEAESYLIAESPKLICMELNSDTKKQGPSLLSLSKKYPNHFFLAIVSDPKVIDPDTNRLIVDHINQKDDVQVIQQKILKWAKAIHSHLHIERNLNQSQGWIDRDILFSRKTEQINLIPQLIKIFATSSPIDLKLIHQASKSGKSELSVLAHKLKGMSANLGAHLFTEICKQIEFYCKEGMRTRAVSLTKHLDFIFQETLTELQVILDTFPPSLHEE